MSPHRSNRLLMPTAVPHALVETAHALVHHSWVTKMRRPAHGREDSPRVEICSVTWERQERKLCDHALHRRTRKTYTLTMLGVRTIGQTT